MSTPGARGGFGELKAGLIIETIARLEQRVGERFPGSGLSRVAGELRRIGIETEAAVARLRGPIWPVRIGACAAVAALVMAVLWLGSLILRTSGDVGNLSDLLQASDAALNDVIFLSLAVFFLFSLETRLKRRRALGALHHLRGIVHIVDMHQLTKDPQHLLGAGATPSSPERTLDRFELARYLDYCSEMLSLASKLAALHVQSVNDPVVLDAVNDIETLAASLSNKVWQKIMILDAVAPG